MEGLNILYRSKFGCDPASVTPLAGSASNRRYYRMSSSSGVCVGVVGQDKAENHAFITLARHFRSKGINVPEVFAASGDGLRYIQEDLGDEVILDRYRRALSTGEGVDEAERLLCRAVACLPKIQFEGAEGLDFDICYPQPEFDMRMLMFDLNYFKYCFLKPSGLEFNEVRLQDDFERFAADLLSFSSDVPTFLYRDFNSRNVMVSGGEPYFIDFQGGRKGPVHYDVASFIWHARSGFSGELRGRMLDAYMDALSEYMSVEKDRFMDELRLFILFRTMQVLGAYGFRGMVEQKAAFMTAVPQALKQLQEVLPHVAECYPYMAEVLDRLASLPRFCMRDTQDGVLEVTVTSFSYKKGIPADFSGNGGGYVFDCRSIHNPGRYDRYKALTGRDEAVIRFLEDDGEVSGFLGHVYGVVDPHVETFMKRGFTSLMVSFGCTGGQHRSVYCAERLASHLSQKYPDVRIRLIHREQQQA